MLLIAAISLLAGHALCQNDFQDPYDCSGDPEGQPEATVSYNEYTSIFTTNRITIASRELQDGVPRLTQQRTLMKSNASYVAAFSYSKTHYKLLRADHTICTCARLVYPCRDCAQTFGGFFKFMPQTSTPQVIKSATDLDDTRILVVFDKPLVMGVFTTDGQQLEPFIKYPVDKMAPSSMSNIRKSGTKNVTLLLCFDQLCGEHHIDPSDLKKPLTPDPSRPYFWSRLLLGCPTDVCFDGSYDTATYVMRNQKTSLLLIRGNYLYELDKFYKDASPPGGTSLQQMQIPRKNYDAAFRTRTLNEKATHYLISDGTILYSQDELAYDKGKNFPHSLKTVKSTFSGFKGHVDAALTLDNGTLHLLQGDAVYRYNPTPNGWSFVDKVAIGFIYDDLPNNIEAAMNSEGNIYFFKKSHYYMYTPKIQTLTLPRLMQQSFYKCDNVSDFVGHDVTDRILGIRTMKQFVDYKTQFIEKPEPITTTPLTTAVKLSTPLATLLPTTEATSNTSAATPGGTASSTSSPSSKSLFGLLVGVMAGLLFLLLSAAIYFLSLKTQSVPKGVESPKKRFPIMIITNPEPEAPEASMRNREKNEGFSEKSTAEPKNMGVITIASDNTAPEADESVNSVN
ncbi:hypothetical protein HDE_13170 [Halotydeus destructor]|nr:hypothetical protein HDE_13170 [Halotydeus destructor]